jgi:transposase InsO family protein
MRFQFIADHQAEFAVRRMCTTLNVSPSGYYAWCKRPPSAREMANQALFQDIETVYNDNDGLYGSPRIHAELQAQGKRCSLNRVARLMRLRHLRARQVRRFKVTTKRDKRHPVAPNLLQRDFVADRPNEKWLSDITYIPTQEGWLYLATVLDLYSRRLVGWAMSERIDGELTLAALQMALEQRQPQPGLIHHSDQGRQYTDRIYQTLLKDCGFQISMNGVGTWYDNAPMESFFGTLKSELIYLCVYRTRNEARTSVFFYIEAFYNRRRRHSALDYLSPEVYEQRYYQQLELGLTPCPQN